ncbi:MAG: hypothetical protein ABSB40_00975 [Nitrososphaeria archaeon]|jgi:hypothetical protein
MSSIKVRNVLLVTFVVLTLIFGSLSAYEFVQVQQVKSLSQTTSTTTVTLPPSTTFTVATSTETGITTSIITVTATVPNVPNEGVIKIGFPNRTNAYFFDYKRMAGFPAGTSVTFKGVTFYSEPLNESLTGCVVYYVKVTFPDGTSEVTGAGYCATMVITSIAFTNHSNPTAGVMYAPAEYGLGDQVIDQPVAAGFYLLVSE